ncbi:MAG: FKBP-type peptidyl-prolyl cis-trans isomerase [Chitinophagaceae bacterium]|nr:FKBP-type peptidyl-prolyl cis-trans isomerase [Chitinophagaceae bacterium]
MRKILSLFTVISVAIALSGCVKNTSCKAKTVDSEDAEMLSYASSIGMTPTRHSSGMYYQILNQGSGPAPTYSSVLYVRYTGKLLNGSIFDSATTTPISFNLGGVIMGWQIGLSLLQKGGVIRLIIPSSLGYGCRENGPIPGNSILYFDVELVDVQ